MNSPLLNLIKAKLQLAESCKQESFHAMMIYSETLPALLVQCTGHIEYKINGFLKDKNIMATNDDTKPYRMGSLSVANIQKLKFPLGLKGKNCSWAKPLEDKIQVKTIIDEYKTVISKLYANSDKKEFETAVDYLLSRKDLFNFVPEKIFQQKTHRDDFSHGKINPRSLSIISKQDYYIYYGVLLLVDVCIDHLFEQCNT